MYLIFQNIAHRSVLFFIRRRQIFAPRISESFSGSHKPRPPEDLGRHKVSQATRVHFFVSCTPFHRNFL